VNYKTQFEFVIGNEKKKFDFYWKINEKEYFCETNFFNVPGSKISEVIRFYNHVHRYLQQAQKNFVWVADGKGLKSVKEELRSVYLATDNFFFTISSFVDWIKKEKQN
jgi:hypothetical protein